MTRVDAFAGGAALLLFAAQARGRDALVQVAPAVELHVVDTGVASAKTSLVLIPGWSMPASIWSAQQATLSKDRRVLAVDPRSQGGSTKVAEGNTPEQRARDLRALLEGMLRAIVQRPLAPAEVDRLAREALKTPTSIGAAMLVSVLAAHGSPEVGTQREQAGRMPQARFEVVEGVGHALFLDQPDRFAARVLRFADAAN